MAEILAETGNFSLKAAKEFSEKYAKITNEKQYSQSFWTDLFTKVIGVPDLLAAGIEFEYPVVTSEGKTNWIDILWSGVLLIEQKSAGKDLNLAEAQARGYLVALPPKNRPPAIIVSDFSRIRIIDVLMNEQFEFQLSELSENLHRLELILGNQIAKATQQEVSADIHAVELMGNLFNAFDKAGYEGHALSVFLVRVLFMNFGDDTRMWRRVGNGLFSEFIGNSSENGNGLGAQIQELFQILDTPIEKRPKTISSSLEDFPYINGGIFEENLPIFSFTPEMRKALIETTQYDWSKISPAIFGAMFQTVKSKEDRRSLGEHYTSESNILKVIRPLFLDDYLEKLSKAWESVPALKKLRKDLSENNYLDPACGSGNFLVVAYRRLRELELKIVARLNELEGKEGQNFIQGTWGLSVHLNQFHGIEINEWSSQIATVAMFIADHQANQAMEEITGFSPERFPLKESAKIVHANALQFDWTSVCPMNDKTFIMGNPPFYGARMQSAEQKADTEQVWNGIKKVGDLDFVTNWFRISAELISKYDCVAGFVATNSVSQGEQPAIIWTVLKEFGIKIDYAHQTFLWTNEAKGKAAVHVVVIGISKRERDLKKLWTYSDIKAEAQLKMVKHINPYLVESEDVIITPRKNPISSELPQMFYGNMPNDGGFLSNISPEEAEEIRNADPLASKYLRKILGAREMINGDERWCLWLVNADPSDVKNSKVLNARVTSVKEVREASARPATQKLAMQPGLFGFISQPVSDYIALPRVSSENRNYVPIDYCSSEIVATDALLTIPNGTISIFAILMSRPFNLWNARVSGRLKSDYRISAEITYNNFPLPHLTDEDRETLTKSGNEILEARKKFASSSLADLYGAVSMPIDLVKAHQLNDKNVLKIYGLKKDSSDDDVLAHLFKLFKAMSEGSKLGF